MVSMIANLSASVAALKAYGTRMGVIADNVANLTTDGFKKNRAVLREGPHRTVQADIQPVSTPGMVYQTREGQRTVEKETSNVDLTEEIPSIMTTQHAYSANLKVMQAQDRMLGTLLDVTG
jgi:flagellar basal-body rod protein FlgC